MANVPPVIPMDPFCRYGAPLGITWDLEDFTHLDFPGQHFVKYSATIKVVPKYGIGPIPYQFVGIFLKEEDGMLVGSIPYLSDGSDDEGES